jgi:hypothetical protein
MTDFGLKSPLMLLALFLAPLPILRNIIEAEEAVDEMEMLSVEPVKPPWPE